MAMYVFKDAARKHKLLARDAQKQDKSSRFYCPNKKCNAHMSVRSLDGVSKAYFAANQSQSHVKGCPYKSRRFQPNLYDGNGFVFDDALLSLTMPSKSQSKSDIPGEHGTGEVAPKPIRTIRQIYSMCKSYDCSDSYNGKIIGQMLLDERSAYMYSKGVFGWRLIELKYRYYSSDRKEIVLVCPQNGKEYTFIMRFGNEKLFKEIRKIVYENRNHLIIVAGEWNSSGKYNAFCTEIKSKKQLTIVK
ncbi:hypothetical protein [Priestia endophytica]|uniref:hypothetical protein n=1 Tax=Priestia endophytica TaxID=135735 RepID=UPI002E1A8FA9|nr:hypothetical protein [Priestia endophytica]